MPADLLLPLPVGADALPPWPEVQTPDLDSADSFFASLVEAKYAPMADPLTISNARSALARLYDDLRETYIALPYGCDLRTRSALLALATGLIELDEDTLRPELARIAEQRAWFDAT